MSSLKLLAGRATSLLLALLVWAGSSARSSEPPASAERLVTLSVCIEKALRQNRALQIERLNSFIARDRLSGAFGYYDPVLTADYRREETSDSGGFDPADLSRDAIYSAEADSARLGVIGFLPTGMSYALSGSYANTSGERNGLNFDSYALNAGITLRQPLLRNFWIDQGRLLIRVNRSLAHSAEEGVRFLALSVVNQVQQAYYELLYALEFRKVQMEMHETRQRMLRGFDVRVRQGLMSEAETLATRMQTASLQTLLITASNSVVLAVNELRMLMGEDPREQTDAVFAPAEKLWVFPDEFDLQESWRRGLATRPDLIQLRMAQERGAMEVRFRRNQMFPSVDLVAGYGRRGASTLQLPPPLVPQASWREAFDQLSGADAPSGMVGVVFSMPLGGISERGAYRASRHLEEQAEERVKQMEELVLREISDAVHTARLSLERVRTAEKASQFAERAVAAEERKLEAGTSNVFFLLQLQNDLLSARAAELRAKADHLKAVSQLRFADGSLLDAAGIEFDFEGEARN